MDDGHSDYNSFSAGGSFFLQSLNQKPLATSDWYDG